MSGKIFIVDSFTAEAFKGNPAGVHLIDEPIGEARMQAIARELNLSETAFVSPIPDSDEYAIRYFSPVMEIPLCGHATLASSRIVFDTRDDDTLKFRTIRGLLLEVKRFDDQIEMSFPLYELEPATAPPALLAALGLNSATDVGFNAETNILMLEIDCADKLRRLAPDFAALRASHDSIHGVSVTAPGNDGYDFHSRFFWPWSGGEEDPVTGATHTFLANHWSKKLDKQVMKSFQSSARTGHMQLEITSDRRLLICGQAVVIAEGTLRV